MERTGARVLIVYYHSLVGIGDKRGRCGAGIELEPIDGQQGRQPSGKGEVENVRDGQYRVKSRLMINKRFGADGKDANDPAMRDLLNRISNNDPLYALAVVQVFREDYGAYL
jgi:hypothetical protein